MTDPCPACSCPPFRKDRKHCRAIWRGAGAAGRAGGRFGGPLGIDLQQQAEAKHGQRQQREPRAPPGPHPRHAAGKLCLRPPAAPAAALSATLWAGTAWPLAAAAAAARGPAAGCREQRAGSSNPQHRLPSPPLLAPARRPGLMRGNEPSTGLPGWGGRGLRRQPRGRAGRSGERWAASSLGKEWLPPWPLCTARPPGGLWPICCCVWRSDRLCMRARCTCAS